MGAPWGERGGTAGAQAALVFVRFGAEASRPACQLAWRVGCSGGRRTFASSGDSATGVPPSAATGAGVEPLRTLHGLGAPPGARVMFRERDPQGCIAVLASRG